MRGLFIEYQVFEKVNLTGPRIAGRPLPKDDPSRKPFRSCNRDYPFYFRPSNGNADILIPAVASVQSSFLQTNGAVHNAQRLPYFYSSDSAGKSRQSHRWQTPPLFREFPEFWRMLFRRHSFQIPSKSYRPKFPIPKERACSALTSVR